MDNKNTSNQDLKEKLLCDNIRTKHKLDFIYNLKQSTFNTFCNHIREEKTNNDSEVVHKYLPNFGPYEGIVVIGVLKNNEQTEYHVVTKRFYDILNAFQDKINLNEAMEQEEDEQPIYHQPAHITLCTENTKEVIMFHQCGKTKNDVVPFQTRVFHYLKKERRDTMLQELLYDDSERIEQLEQNSYYAYQKEQKRLFLLYNIDKHQFNNIFHLIKNNTYSKRMMQQICLPKTINNNRVMVQLNDKKNNYIQYFQVDRSEYAYTQTINPKVKPVEFGSKDSTDITNFNDIFTFITDDDEIMMLYAKMDMMKNDFYLSFKSQHNEQINYIYIRTYEYLMVNLYQWIKTDVTQEYDERVENMKQFLIKQVAMEKHQVEWIANMWKSFDKPQFIKEPENQLFIINEKEYQRTDNATFQLYKFIKVNVPQHTQNVELEFGVIPEELTDEQLNKKGYSKILTPLKINLEEQLLNIEQHVQFIVGYGKTYGTTHGLWKHYQKHQSFWKIKEKVEKQFVVDNLVKVRHQHGQYIAEEVVTAFEYFATCHAIKQLRDTKDKSNQYQWDTDVSVVPLIRNQTLHFNERPICSPLIRQFQKKTYFWQIALDGNNMNKLLTQFGEGYYNYILNLVQLPIPKITAKWNKLKQKIVKYKLNTYEQQQLQEEEQEQQSNAKKQKTY